MNPSSVCPLFVSLTGSPFERGRIHGETLRSVIRDTVERWQYRIEDILAVPFQDYLSSLMTGSGFRRAIQRLTPDLLDEIDGIAEGCGLDKNLIYAWQLIDEHSWFIEHLQREKKAMKGTGVVLLGEFSWRKTNR